MRSALTGTSSGLLERSATAIDCEGHSPYAMAQDGLAELIEASVQAQRVEAMNAAMRVDLIFLTVSYAVRSEEAFVAPSLSPQRRREMVHRSVTAELATALHLPERTMERHIDDAWALSTTLPATLAALRAGSISIQHARVIVDETTELGDDPGLRGRLEEQLARVATTTTAATLRRKARALREELGAETLAERHRAAHEQRRIELDAARDGMAWLHAFLPAVDASLIKDRLDRVARETGDDTEVRDWRAHDNHLTADQIRADAARDLLLFGTLDSESTFAAAVDRVRPSVHVTVPVLTLIGVSDDAGLLDGYGPIDADSARRLAAHAPSFTRILTHPVTGTVLDVDRTNYRPPADLKRWLRVRDETCRFPGCNRRAVGCEIDHTRDWDDDGRTAFDNLAHLCALHHHLKHETSWSVRHQPGGVLEWTSPAGRTHRTHPGRRIPGCSDTTGPAGRDPAGRRSSADRDPATAAVRGAPPPAGADFPESPPF